MRTVQKHMAALLLVAVAGAFGLAVSEAGATPTITSAVIETRIFNDDPTSVISTGNTYANPPNAGSIFIEDAGLDGDGVGGWANRHIWRFSGNGIDEAVFLNGDGFAMSADVTISGSANTEAGLQVSPWWSQDVDGTFVVLPHGEIAAFGGRLPFYSFNSQGVSYTKGETVGLGLTYVPRDLTAALPAVIQYTVTQGAMTYASPWLPFDEANVAEGPTYGLWGMLNNARVGGFMQTQINTADPNNLGRVDFDNVSFVPEPATLALLAMGGLMLRRRR